MFAGLWVDVKFVLRGAKLEELVDGKFLEKWEFFEIMLAWNSLEDVTY